VPLIVGDRLAAGKTTNRDNHVYTINKLEKLLSILFLIKNIT